MGRKARQRTAPESGVPSRDSVNGAAAEAVDGRYIVESALVAGGLLTISLVILWFSLDVNRVFDVPKAYALKTGGSLLLLAWLGWSTFGPGVRWRSLRLFLVPVLALLGSVALSTVFSIDPRTSLVGVYERQFGLEGLMACTALFVVMATGLSTKRGAVVGLIVLMLLGGLVSAYALLQAVGLDPYGFFKQPTNKAYANLGNATFAGNSLALIFPISFVVASVGTWLGALRPSDDSGNQVRSLGTIGAWLAGVVLIVAVWVLPGVLAGQDLTLDLGSRQTVFKFGGVVGVVMVALLGGFGSHGVKWLQAETATVRKLADAMLAGALTGVVLLMVVGLYTTRTRGAWVGTATAMAAMLLLFPLLFRDEPRRMWRLIVVGVGGTVTGAAILALFVLVLAPDHLASHTIKSIPHAFQPEKAVYGVGQGTRPYLWKESIRALVEHGQTVDRIIEDRADYANHVPKSEWARDFRQTDWLPSGVRRAAVWAFGVGFETYRYAFMSHKSKKLEALDPMTNHDNPHNNYLYVLAGCGLVGLLAYLWLLWRLLSASLKHFLREGPREDRAIGFGVVLSFASYAVYSIAGFDSVASSVFLYVLLGCAAVFFAPSAGEEPEPLADNVRRHWMTWRGHSVAPRGRLPLSASVALLVVFSPLAVHSLYSASEISRAEKAFVGGDVKTFADRLTNLESAIAKNPGESFYHQSLGNAHSEAARQYRQHASDAQRAGTEDRARGYLEKAEFHRKSAEKELYSALNHAWAPENIFISLFQLYYGWNDLDAAILALERGLEHSPHLAPVRANLAILRLTHQRDFAGALADSLWVLDIDPQNLHALRTAGRAYYEQGDLQNAKAYLDRAQQRSPTDPSVRQYVADLERALAKPATVSATGGG